MFDFLFYTNEILGFYPYTLIGAFALYILHVLVVLFRLCRCFFLYVESGKISDEKSNLIHNADESLKQMLVDYLKAPSPTVIFIDTVVIFFVGMIVFIMGNIIPPLWFILWRAFVFLVIPVLSVIGLAKYLRHRKVKKDFFIRSLRGN